VLEDYPHDAPSISDDDEPWSCPLPLPPLEPAATEAERLSQGLQSEVSFLLPWYGEAKRRKGRTLFGLSGLTPTMPSIWLPLSRLLPLANHHCHPLEPPNRACSIALYRR
jgi:hypothetical protein